MLIIMFIVFQSLFGLASFPMDLIDQWTGSVKEYVAAMLPVAWWSNLITEGIIAGIGGVVIFVPQIAILFLLITLLEETGYMSRVSFLTDKIMQKVGMNGRSVMPLVSGMACAIPAVMAARTISNPKERLLTILVTPFMSCSARLPVYTLIIAMVVPDMTFGPFNLQGLVMMSMYVLGIAMSLLVAFVLNKVIKSKSISYYIMELPSYRWPRWKNAFMVMFDKAKIFLLDAGKIIIIISIVLWFMSSYGPSSKMEAIENKYAAIEAKQTDGLSVIQAEEKANELLSSSYAGILGHAIEPAIKPLGYDWKIGIAILSSFAAREVFVGTMATLYSVGTEAAENEGLLRDKMSAAKRKDGTPVYTLATGVSLLMFYAFAMQCISTIAIVKRETNSWKWALFQTVFMTGIAYIFAFIAYQTLR
jgi:ferrous iron transport protein B